VTIANIATTELNMNNQDKKIVGTDEAWESGQLGQDERFVQVAPAIDENLINESLDLQLISIRLQKSLIEDLKAIARINGLGYQPLMRQILTRFAEAEKRQMLMERALEGEKLQQKAKKPLSKRKVA